ncbi:hypothetical protein TRICI_000696 [Trichomonascus ciferrii]|uniref:LrgB-like protein n=1 Tax=Trichomonascus ciferrii TaxID=44093 RepID=A0A642VBB2_9ASCO|nr:hypothetical protein TRICI_000696 [Trichomonascus ciferrii]
MLILFVLLLVLEYAIGTRRVSKLLEYIKIPADFCLAWMSIVFTPSFVLLPLATPVGRAEAFKIAAVFIIGYFVMMIGLVYLVSGLQKLSNVRRRPYDEDTDSSSVIELHERGNATGAGGNKKYDESSSSEGEGSAGPAAFRRPELENSDRLRSNSPLLSQVGTNPDFPPWFQPPQPTAYVTRPNNPGLAIPERCLGGELSRMSNQMQQVQETRGKPPRVKETAAFVVAKFDWIVYGLLCVAGIPLYFAIDYSMLLHLSIVVLTFYSTAYLPKKYKAILHPIPVCGGLSILFIYLFAAMHSESVQDALKTFKTGRNYLTLFGNPDYEDLLPGAGDVLSSLLDVSIVALALPMYNYRTDLKRHLFMLVVPTIVAGVLCFFIYPPLCYAIGISSERSLAFIARSATLALALPITSAVGGSSSLISVVAILSGIFGVLFGQPFLGRRGLRVREDDYVTRGVTLGVCSSAVASASLLTTDPRAAAMSSLSFFLYGIVMILLAAIPPIVTAVRSWVDLGPME